MGKKLMHYVSEEEQIYRLNEVNYNSRGTLIEIHIADLHFGVIDPQYQYNILEEQFLRKISDIHFDILSIDGDLYEHKYMSNSDATMYGTMFVDRCMSICRDKGATFILIAGTKSHDDNQLKLFYHYLNDNTVDFRIVEEVKLEYVKGAKILCIPELYGKKEDYYNKFLFGSKAYDSVFMHGEIKGSVHGSNIPNLNSDKYPIFCIEDFALCRGPIISGHVHTGGCFESYFYYTGTPYRYRFGEENEKGFLIVLHNLDTHYHYTHLEPIKSYRYDTINLDNMIDLDPKDIISYVSSLKDTGIDYIRLEFNRSMTDIGQANLTILNNYYKTNQYIKILAEDKTKRDIIDSTNIVLDKYKEYGYIMDKSLNEQDILCKFINHQKGYTYITVEELKLLLEKDI